MDILEEQFNARIGMKNAADKTEAYVLCEPAQSKLAFGMSPEQFYAII